MSNCVYLGLKESTSKLSVFSKKQDFIPIIFHQAISMTFLNQSNHLLIGIKLAIVILYNCAIDNKKSIRNYCNNDF